MQVAEPLTSQSIFPYINQVGLVRRSWQDSFSLNVRQFITELNVTGGDHRKVGYYAGIIVEWTLVLVQFYEHWLFIFCRIRNLFFM